MADWLTQMLRENLSRAETDTPYDDWLTNMLRANLEKSEPDPDDWLSNDPHVQKGLAELARGDVTLKQDAEAVLGDALDEVSRDLLAELERLRKLTRRSKSGAMVLKSDDDDGFWTSILKSQLRAKLKRKAQYSQDPTEYREWLSQADESLRSRGKDDKTDWQKEFGNPQS
jgi:hypothetical protein